MLREINNNGIGIIITLPELLINERGVSDVVMASTLPWDRIIIYLYFSVVLFLIGRVIIQLITLMLNLRKLKNKEVSDVNVYINTGLKTPYSFFHCS